MGNFVSHTAPDEHERPSDPVTKRFLPHGLHGHFESSPFISKQAFCDHFQYIVHCGKIYDYIVYPREDVTLELLEKQCAKLTAMPPHKTEEQLNECGLDANMVISIIMNDIMLIEGNSMEKLHHILPAVYSSFNSRILELLQYESVTPHESLCSVSFERYARLVDAMCNISTDGCHLLYSTRNSGFSFKSLAAGIRYYSGGILCILNDESRRIFGFYCFRSEWSDTGGDFDGSAVDCTLFQLEPEVRVRRLHNKGKTNYLYFNSSKPQYPKGIGLGGRVGTFRFFINGENLVDASSMESDATFEGGQLLTTADSTSPMINTSVVHIDVYGLNSKDGLNIQQTKRVEGERLKENQRKVDKTRLVETQFDREMLLPKTFGGTTSGKTIDV